MKHKFNDLGSIKTNMLTLNIKFHNNAIPLDSKNAFFHRSIESFQIFKDVQRLLAGLQIHYTGYSYNPISQGVHIPLSYYRLHVGLEL